MAVNLNGMFESLRLLCYAKSIDIILRNENLCILSNAKLMFLVAVGETSPRLLLFHPFHSSAQTAIATKPIPSAMCAARALSLALGLLSIQHPVFICRPRPHSCVFHFLFCTFVSRSICLFERCSTLAPLVHSIERSASKVIYILHACVLHNNSPRNFLIAQHRQFVVES